MSEDVAGLRAHDLECDSWCHGPECQHHAALSSPETTPAGVLALDEAIEALLGTPRPPVAASGDVESITAWELAVQRVRIAYGAERGLIEPCPVPSSVTGQPCLLPAGHPQDSPDRFHRYAATPAGVLDEAALREALNRLGPGTIADMAWSPAKWEWRADLGYWAAVEDEAGHTVDDEYPMASLARALAVALGRSGSGGGRG